MESFFVPQANSKYLIGMRYKTTVTKVEIIFVKAFSKLVSRSRFRVRPKVDGHQRWDSDFIPRFNKILKFWTVYGGQTTESGRSCFGPDKEGSNKWTVRISKDRWLETGRSLENELDCLTSENWTVFSWRFQFKNLLRERAMQSVNVACGLIQIKV